MIVHGSNLPAKTVRHAIVEVVLDGSRGAAVYPRGNVMATKVAATHQLRHDIVGDRPIAGDGSHPELLG
jgi:hypothetical protein